MIATRSMKLIDVSVPLDERLPNYPGNAPLNLEPVKRLARGDSSNVSTLASSAHAGRTSTRRGISTMKAAASRRCRSSCSAAPRVWSSWRRAPRSRRRTWQIWISPRRRTAADQDVELAVWGDADVSRRLCRRRRVGGDLPGRARRQSGRRGLPVGRAVQDARRADASHPARGRHDRHRGIEPARRRTRQLRDVLPAAVPRRSDGAPARVVLRRS